jgi:phage pi2 protein 07
MATVTEVLHYPTLKTVLMVENILREAKEPLTRYEIMKRMKNKVMRQSLNIIIQYLVERNMVIDSEKGVLWVYTPKEKLNEWLKDSVEI